jgi:hypothetical protein
MFDEDLEAVLPGVRRREAAAHDGAAHDGAAGSDAPVGGRLSGLVSRLVGLLGPPGEPDTDNRDDAGT